MACAYCGRISTDPKAETCKGCAAPKPKADPVASLAFRPGMVNYIDTDAWVRLYGGGYAVRPTGRAVRMIGR